MIVVCKIKTWQAHIAMRFIMIIIAALYMSKLLDLEYFSFLCIKQNAALS